MIQTRLTHLRKALQKQSLDAVFVSSIPTITYLTSFSGFDTEDRNAFLLITATKQYIFTHGIYKEAAQKYVKDFTLVDIAREKPLSSSLFDLIEKHHINKIGFEGYDLRFSEYQAMSKKIKKNMLIPIDTLTEKLREKKSLEEINAIEKACQLGDKAFTFLLTKIKEGISEKELALEYELFVKRNGATISFETIVAFGSNGSLPHHIPTDKRLTKNSFIVLDFGVKLENYCSDMTRTVFFGKADATQKKMYHTVLASQEEAIAYIKKTKKISAQKADEVARNYIVAQGYPDIPHSLGHGIGLLVHEMPRLSPYSKDILSDGMVFSIEPGIYIPDYGGVRIEDLFAITKNKLRVLTHAPKELIELS